MIVVYLGSWGRGQSAECSCYSLTIYSVILSLTLHGKDFLYSELLTISALIYLPRISMSVVITIICNILNNLLNYIPS